jgi:hypothetical protein
MRRLALALSAALTLLASSPAQADPGLSAARFHDQMRKLWEDHVGYTALFYTAVIFGGDDAGVVAARLLRNQDDIGDAVKPFYGDAAGAQLSALLREHILVAADLVGAAKVGDAAAVEAATERWYANADAIAAFLAAANPFWSEAALREALHMHLAMTTDGVLAKLRGDTAGAIAAYDAGHQHMLEVADTLSSGIVKQFPSRFRGVRPFRIR